MWWIYPVYVILALAIIYLSYLLGNYVDALDKKTKISGAFIGGILLAAVTSLPELFTSISSIVLIGETGMVVGNILGSDLFNFMVLGISIVLFVKRYKKAKIDKIHVYSLLIVIAMAAITLYAILAPTNFQPLVGPINLLTILIIGLYVLNLFLQPKESEASEEGDTLNLTVKQIIVRFIICAVLLVSVSVAITYATDILAKELNLSATVAGSLFLAIATSLPEVVSTLTLCKKGNFNAGFGNIIGSNVFNFTILSLSEFISWNNSVFVSKDKEAFLMAAFLILSCVLTLVSIFILFKYQKKDRTKKVSVVMSISSIVLGLIIFSGYIAYLLVNQIPFTL
jgi:cation:H+ antiporter